MQNGKGHNSSISNGGTLCLTSCIEKSTVSCDAVHNLQAMIQLNAVAMECVVGNVTQKPIFNFVVVIDVSSSMRQHNKLTHVQATIEYMLNQLESHHNFCLIQFNEVARYVCCSRLIFVVVLYYSFSSLLQLACLPRA